MEDIMRKLIEWLKSLFGAGVKPVDQVKEPKKAAVAKGPKKTVTAKAVSKPAKTTKAQLNKLTKAQLEEKGREIGLELDKRKKKAFLVDEVYTHIK
tara:strand:+ start:2136 stop:2423 length:288 start_codon:yes stop_codon:yes gene_type:complete